MILVTVGSQEPFDRLVATVDDWAGEYRRGDIFAQIGPGEREPRHMRWERFLRPPEFRRRMESASLIIAHAGMGTIITAMELEKPILVMPRRGDLSETRNDHQVATAMQFRGRGLVEVAMDEAEMRAKLAHIDELLRRDAAGPVGCLHRPGTCMFAGPEGCLQHRHGSACPNLIGGLRAFIAGEPVHTLTRPEHTRA